ncbi:MAG: NirD/YgiW/YdeI family stress tolerance protein [Nevskiaceae bacterium]|nr:MAG: NirD/YgiW/YdeI family stress tolerance protein [Nevskiaceae bacterium]TBR72598.1 MAG: NirD/YgiW/YdeI family stress tolerance protein [Nevskiaceae bacterium]
MPKLHRTPILLLGAALALPAAVAFAQYTGPSTAPGYSSVAAILKKPVDDSVVSLKGYIVQKTGHEKYVFSDGTGQITVEIDDHRLPTTPFNDKTKVQISGEVDKDMMQAPKVDVKTITLVQP